MVFKLIWSCPINLKVIVFSWQFFLGCILTEDNLFRRNVLRSLADPSCVLRSSAAETVSHLFLQCPFFVTSGVQSLVGMDFLFVLQMICSTSICSLEAWCSQNSRKSQL